MVKNFFNNNFVWWSSSKSIEAGKISLLAVIEVIFSVAAFWWIAWYFDTYAHLLSSVMVAPLVLLRCDQSVALGAEMFTRYWRRDELSLRFPWGISIVILSVGASFGVSWLTADWFLSGREGWSLFWHSMLLGFLAMNVALAAFIAGTGMEAITKHGVVVFGVAVAGLATVTLMGLGAIPTAGLVSVPVAMAGSVIAVWATRPEWGEKLVKVLVAMFGLSVGIGNLSRAIATRLFASMWHFRMSFADLPLNWQRTLFQIDLRCMPELVPGISAKVPALDFKTKIHSLFFRPDDGGKLLVVVVLPIIYIPSLVYRYSLKSTCWLYLPLIYLAQVPRRLRDGTGRLVWVRALPSKYIEVIRLAFAVLTLTIAFIALIDAAALKSLLMAAGAGDTPVTILNLLLVLDFTEMRPWHYFTLPSAFLTVILVLWLDSIRKEEAAGATIDPLGWSIGAAIFTNQIRNMLVAIWLGLALYYFAEFAYNQCRLPEWMESWFKWNFGVPTCRDLPPEIPSH